MSRALLLGCVVLAVLAVWALRRAPAPLATGITHPAGSLAFELVPDAGTESVRHEW